MSAARKKGGRKAPVPKVPDADRCGSFRSAGFNTPSEMCLLEEDHDGKHRGKSGEAWHRDCPAECSSGEVESALDEASSRCLRHVVRVPPDGRLGPMRVLQCDYRRECKHPVTHVGHRGFVYCEQDAGNMSGGERTRKLKADEIAKLQLDGLITF